MSYTMQFLIILALVALGTLKTTLQGRISKKYIRNSQDTLIYNAEVFAAIEVVMAVIFKVSVPDKTLVCFALAGACTTLIFQSTYSVALSTGPVSLTVLIVNFNVLLTTAVSVFVFKDKFYLTQLFGILLLFVSMFLSTAKMEDGQKVNAKWLILTIIAAVSTAAGALLQKCYGKLPTEVEASDTTFLFFMYGFASIFGALTVLLRRYTGKKEKSTMGFNKAVLGVSCIIGLVLGLYQKLYMNALVNIDGTLLFPTYAGLASLAMTLIGVVMFKDSLSKKQIWGVVCGIVCVALMNLRIGFYF